MSDVPLKKKIPYLNNVRLIDQSKLANNYSVTIYIFYKSQYCQYGIGIKFENIFQIRQFNIDAQNWKLSVSDYQASKKSDKKTKKFTGTKVGGIDDSSMYFVMHQREGGIFEAFPVDDW